MAQTWTSSARPKWAATRRRAKRARCPRCRREDALRTVPTTTNRVVVGVTQECRWRADGCTYAAYTDLTVVPHVTMEV